MPSNSKSQQRFMGMVHQCKKSGKCASAQVKKVADSMKDSDAKDFASTKHEGLPNKVSNESTTPTFKEFLIELESYEEVKQANTELNSMLSPLGLTFDFGSHGTNDRIMKRERSVTIEDLTGTMGRFLGRYGKALQAAIDGDGVFKATIKDYANNINMVVDLHNDDNVLYLVTLMRKPPNQFKTDDFPNFRVVKVF